MDWLLEVEEVHTRAAAVELGQLLVDTDFIHHVVDEHFFEDSYLFFRFKQDGKLLLLLTLVLLSLRPGSQYETIEHTLRQ